MRRRGRVARGLAVLVGFVAGALLTLAVQGPDVPPLAPEAPIAVAPAPPRVAEAPGAFLAWTPGRMPDGFASRARALGSIRHAVVVMSGTAWLTESRSASGAIVDRPPGGLAVPLELAAVDPAAYRPFVPPAERALVAALSRGEVILGAASAELRRLGEGGILRFGGTSARVAGVLPDEFLGAHEVLASLELGGRLGVTRPRYALLDPVPGTPRNRLAAAVRSLVPPGTALRLRAPGETPYFRHGDAVLPPVTFKTIFGEFAARPTADGWLRVDPAWEAEHIATEAVPILGDVRCARALFPQLRGAMEEIRRAGLARLIDTGDFGGCYGPRFLNRDPGAGISHHAWGAALDLNVSQNLFGRVPTMDQRLVAIFERWGFTWGGRWLVPDGMHFEFVGATAVGG